MSAIARVSTQIARLALHEPLATSIRTYNHLDIVLVQVQSDDGSAGWGEARECRQITGETQAGIVEAVNSYLGPALIGLDPCDINEAHRRMDGVLFANTAAKSAIDMALHDLAGRLSGLPVCTLLGGGPGPPISSSKAVSVGDADSMVDAARRFSDAGFLTLKIKTGVDSECELNAIAAIRDAVGPDVHIKLDANQGWTLPQATDFLAAVQQYGIQMVEQPLAAWDLNGHAELRRRTPIPVMLDEGVHGPRDVLRALEADAADYINIKLIKTGGLAPARELAAICDAAGIMCQIGTLDSTIGSAAAAHLVHACRIIRFAEINGPSRMSSDVAEGFRIDNGHAIISGGPGLGIMVLDEIIAGAVE